MAVLTRIMVARRWIFLAALLSLWDGVVASLLKEDENEGALALAAAGPRLRPRARTLDFEIDFGGIPFDDSPAACERNKEILNGILQHNASGYVLVIPYNKTFHVHHGVFGLDVRDFVLRLDGALQFERIDYKSEAHKHPAACFEFYRGNNVTVTSDHRGLMDGRGPQYWGVPMIGYLEIEEHRPRLLVFNQTTHLTVERIILQDSPYHTLYLWTVNHAVVRHVSIVARRTKKPGHSWIDLTAFNTDGIDVSGHNVHIHDVDIWTQDDCIAVKGNPLPTNPRTGLGYASTNMTFERVNASGLGIVIGSIGGSRVQNITFKDCYLHHSVKGIYLKFNSNNQFWKRKHLFGLIENVTFSNIVMERPTQWAVWIGPAQQADARNPCHPNPCSLCWPMTPGSQCNVVDKAKYKNITLDGVRINNPKMSPGVILGSDDNVMEGVLFRDVRVTQGNPVPWAKEKLTKTFPGLKQPIRDPYVLLADSNQSGELLGGFVQEDEQERGNGLFSSQSVLWLIFSDPIAKWICVLLLGTWMLTVLYTACWEDDRPPDSEGDYPMREPFLAYSSGTVERSRHLGPWRTGRHAIAVVGILLLVLCVVATRMTGVSLLSSNPFTPSWDKTDRYYKCEGVVDGKAVGNTWPVPTCFDSKQVTGWGKWDWRGIQF